MKVLYHLFAAVLLLVLPTSTPCQDDIGDGIHRTLNIKIEGADVRDVLRQFFKGWWPYSLDPEVSGNITVAAQKAEWIVCLRSMLLQVHATYSVDANGTYQIVPLQKLSENRISISFDKTPFRTAVEQLFLDQGAVVVMPHHFAPITGAFRNEKPETILAAICKQAGGFYNFFNGIYTIFGQVVEKSVKPGPSDDDRSIVVIFRDVPAWAALESISDIDWRPMSIRKDFPGTVSALARFETKDSALNWLTSSLDAEVVDNRIQKRVKPIPLLDFDFKSTDIRDAIRLVMNASGRDYSIGPEIQGTVTGQFKGTFESVLFELLQRCGSHCQIESGVVQIVVNEPIRRPS